MPLSPQKANWVESRKASKKHWQLCVLTSYHKPRRNWASRKLMTSALMHFFAVTWVPVTRKDGHLSVWPWRHQVWFGRRRIFGFRHRNVWRHRRKLGRKQKVQFRIEKNSSRWFLVSMLRIWQNWSVCYFCFPSPPPFLLLLAPKG